MFILGTKLTGDMMDVFRRRMLLAELKSIVSLGGNISRAKIIQRELKENSG